MHAFGTLPKCVHVYLLKFHSFFIPLQAFQIASNQEPASSITRNILFGTVPQYKIPGNSYNRVGRAEGILVGGNLSNYS